MACAQVPLDEQQVTEKGPLGKEQTLPALVSHITSSCTKEQSKNHLTHLSQVKLYQKENMCLLFHISTRQGRRTVFLCLTNPLQKTALPLRWRSFWNMPNSSQRTWSGCWHCPMTSSGVRWGAVIIKIQYHNTPLSDQVWNVSLYLQHKQGQILRQGSRKHTFNYYHHWRLGFQCRIDCCTKNALVQGCRHISIMVALKEPVVTLTLYKYMYSL